MAITKLKGQVAIVTGVSHSQGIGTSICRKLAKEGADIFFTYWDSKSGWSEMFQNEIQEIGVRCESLEIDLSEANAVFKILDTISTKLGFPTILVNNAAHSTRDGYLELDAKTLDDHYSVNMRATFLLCVEFARRFKKSNTETGRIINMTSGLELGPMPGELVYVATKGAISAFTRSLSAELAPIGITVNAVNPGPTDTGWMTEDIKQQLLPKFLSGRIGLPQDVKLY